MSSEYTTLSILEYLYINTKNTPVSKYHIITKVHGIRHQRSDRVSNIMDILERNGFIKSMNTPNATFYQITEKGSEVYLKWVKDFLEFARLAQGLDKED
ncbi:MAG: DUF4364 family protein [Thermoproteota archaeon]|nr:DUF4364 family protein [Thermoproteota archaeon]